MTKRLPKVKSGPGAVWPEVAGASAQYARKVAFDPDEAKAEAAAAAAQAQADEAYAREVEIYDKYSLREIANASAVSGFRRRSKPRNPAAKTEHPAELARAVRLSDKAAEERHRALDEAERRRAAIDNPKLAPPVDDTAKRIRQGVKASVETVPMPVRLEVTQVRMLKVLAAQDGTTASAIIRDCIGEHLDRRLTQDKAFADAVRAALKE